MTEWIKVLAFIALAFTAAAIMDGVVAFFLSVIAAFILWLFAPGNGGWAMLAFAGVALYLVNQGIKKQ